MSSVNHKYAEYTMSAYRRCVANRDMSVVILNLIMWLCFLYKMWQSFSKPWALLNFHIVIKQIWICVFFIFH